MIDQIKPVIKVSLYVLAATLIIWVIFPVYRTQAVGFMLGMMVSLINAWILMVKIEAFSRNIIEKTEKRVNLGFVSRVCMAIIAVMAAIKLPQVDLVFTIIGMFFVQLATLLKGLFFAKKQ